MNRALVNLEETLLGVGFADPVHEAQACFRRLMGGMARPGTVLEACVPSEPPEPLAPVAAALLLTLCDADTTVWLAPALRASRWSRTWLRFHTGAPVVEAPEDADFVVATGAGDCPPFHDLAQGSDEYPDRSATVLLPVEELGAGENFMLEGPGIDGRTTLAVAGLPDDFAGRWRTNGARFPCGVDLILVTDHAFACLPRTTTLAR